VELQVLDGGGASESGGRGSVGGRRKKRVSVRRSHGLHGSERQRRIRVRVRVSQRICFCSAIARKQEGLFFSSYV
jgi:hypothetical protein